MKQKLYLSGGFVLVAFVFFFAANGFSFVNTTSLKSEISELAQRIDESQSDLLAQLIISRDLLAWTPDGITATSAILKGRIMNFSSFVSQWNVPQNSIVYYFNYSTDPSFPANGTLTSNYRVAATAMNNAGWVTMPVSNLTPGTTYHSRLCIAASGTTNKACSSGAPFLTPPSVASCVAGTNAIHILSPNGGQYLTVGGQMTAEWRTNTGGTGSSFKISLVDDNNQVSTNTVVASAVLPTINQAGNYTATLVVPSESYHGYQKRLKIECIPSGSTTPIADTSDALIGVGAIQGLINPGGGMGQSFAVFQAGVPMEFTNDIRITARSRDLYIARTPYLGNLSILTSLQQPGIVYDIAKAHAPANKSAASGTLAVQPTAVSLDPVVLSDLSNVDADPGAVYQNDAVIVGNSIKIPANKTGHIVLRGTFTPPESGYYFVPVYKVAHGYTPGSTNLAFRERVNYVRGLLVDIFTVGN